MGFIKNLFTKNPTIAQEYTAYAAGAKKEFDAVYNEYVQSVETVDKAVRVIANIASMGKMKVYADNGTDKLKPLKVKNIDLEYAINETDGQADFLRKSFASIFVQGAAIIIAEKSRQTGFIGFYPYDPARFAITATEKATLSTFTYTNANGNEMVFDAKDIIYVNNTIDVTNLAYPMSRLKPLNDMMLLQANIMKQTIDYYSGGAKDSIIISPKEPMSAESARSVKAVFDEFVRSRQTRTLLLNAEVDVESVSNAQTPQEIMNALVIINKVIVEAFGIPEYLFGNYSGYVNDAAVKTACRLFFEIQMKPVFISFAHQMTRYFRETLKIKNAKVMFDYKDIEILHDNLETKVELAGKMLKLGIISLNESRELCEMPAVATAAADLHWLPSYLVSSRPVSIEGYEELLANGFFDTDAMPEQPSGASGDEDNATLLTAEETNTVPET